MQNTQDIANKNLEIQKIEKLCGFKLPPIYLDFVLKIQDGNPYDVGDTGVGIYSIYDLTERNTTYDIQKWENDALFIAQDGDTGYYLRRNEGEKIFELDLGALGSLPMRLKGDDIHDFIKNIIKEWEEDEFDE